MSVTLHVVRLGELALFSFLAVRAFRQWQRRGEAAAAWLAATFGVLAVVVFAGELLPTHSTSPVVEWLRKLTVMAVLLVPFCLYRFTDAFVRFSPGIRAGASVLGLLPIAVTAVLPDLPEEGAPRPSWFPAYVLLVLVSWTALSVLAAVRLWRAGRAQPVVPRRRMRMLGLGALVLVAALLVGALGPSDAPPGLQLVLQLAGLATATLFFLGFALPAALRTLWRQPELEAFHRAEAALITTSSPAEVAAAVLPHAVRLLGGRGALMADLDHAVLATHGLEPGEAADLARSLPDGAVARPDGAPAVLADDVVAFPLRGGWLAVQTSRYTPFFGHEELALIGALGRTVDVALERAAGREALEEREQQLAQAQRLAHLGSWAWEIAEDRVVWSDELYRIFGLTPADAGGSMNYEAYLVRVHPDDRATVDAIVTEAFETCQPFTVDHRVVLPDGDVRRVHGRGRVAADETGRPVRMEGTAQDVTEQWRHQDELAALARQQAAVARLGQRALEGVELALLLQEATDVVAVVLDVELVAVLEIAADQEPLVLRAGVGWPEALVGEPVVRGSHAGYTIATRGPVVVEDLVTEARFEPSPVLAGQGAVSGVSVMVQGHGSPFGVLQAHARRARSFTANDVDFLQAVANVLATAIERQHSEQELAHHALHDTLTGLPNRALLLDRLAQALARARRQPSRLAVLFLDLDHFKVVNDGLGHSAGDELLVAVADRVRAAVRPADTVARFGGDEFVVLSEGVVDERDAAVIAERIGQAMAVPVVVAGREAQVSASIGIVLSDGRRDGPETLLRDADAAMYRAKERGRARYELFDRAMRERVMTRLDTELSLRRALERDELRLLYQPEVSLGDGTIVGVEALARWEHPERGLLTPADFLSVAEETGLIVPMGRWVLETACRQLRAWQETIPALGSFVVWVNLSARQLTQPDLPAMVAEIAARTGIDPAQLGIELTESVLMEDVEAVGAALSALQRLDVQLAIDDFGTGFSSLSYLRRFPVGVLKIDRSFVDGLGVEPGDTAIVRAVVGLAHSLGLVAVAEGVETARQVAALQALGCDVGQGYYLSVPREGRVVTGLLRAGQVRPGVPRPATGPLRPPRPAPTAPPALRRAHDTGAAP